MPKLIIEPKKAKDGQIEFIVNYHDPKSDNSFTITTTNDLNEAVDKMKSTLVSEVELIKQKKSSAAVLKFYPFGPAGSPLISQRYPRVPSNV
jgi:hypothetical protein